MAQKRLNKNLVGGLTIVGILLSVAAVYVGVQTFAPRDPEAFARTARQRMASGDYAQAAGLFRRAFDVSQGERGQKNVKYLVEASGCMYKLGAIPDALRTLSEAHAQEPENKEVMTAYLDRLWELFRLGVMPPQADLRQFASDLLALEPDNVLGLTSRALAGYGEANRESPEAKAGEAALEHAVQVAPDDARCILLRLQREYQAALEKSRKAANAGAKTDQIARDYRAVELKLLEDGVKANPTDPQLLTRYVAALLIKDPTDVESPRHAVEAAIQAAPDNPDLHMLMARLEMDVLARKRRDFSDAEFQAGLQRAGQEAGRAAALEPALYEAYTLHAQSLIAARAPEGLIDTNDPKKWETALDVYNRALDATVRLQSVRHAVSAIHPKSGRLLLIVNAMRAALTYASQATGAEADQRLKWAQKFLDQGQILAPTHGLTYFMRGQYLVAKHDFTGAAKAFDEAASKHESIADWLEAFGQLPSERLALLYQELRQYGEALKYTDQAIGEYKAAMENMIEGVRGVPLPLVILRGTLLVLLERAQEGLDFVDAQLPIYNNDSRLLAVKIDALRAVGRLADAQKLIDQLGTGDDQQAFAIQQIRMLVSQKKYAEAEPILREFLTNHADDLRMVGLWRDVVIQLDQRGPAREFLKTLIAKTSNEQTKHALAAYDVVLAANSNEERDAALLKLIEQNSDPKLRAEEFYNFWMSRGNKEKARPYLEEAAKIDPNDLEIMELQFYSGLLEDPNGSEKLLPRLAAVNGDKAEGAIYRGDLAMARSNAEEAIKQYETAEQKLPKNSTIKVRKARAYMGAKQNGRAVEELEAGLEINPRDFAAHKLLFSLYKDQREHDRAVAHLKKALDLNPIDADLLKNQTLIEDQKDPFAAIDRRQKLRADKPKDVDNLLQLGDLYSRAAQIHAAQGDTAAVAKDAAAGDEVIKAISALDPGNLELGQLAAHFYADTKQRAAAEQVLRAFLDAQSGRGKLVGHSLLARCYEALGDKEAAEAGYKNARDKAAEVLSDRNQAAVARGEASLDLVNFYVRQRRFDDAVATAGNARSQLDKSQTDQAALIQRMRKTLIDSLLQAGKLADAETEINSYLTDYSGDVAGLLARAQLFTLRHDRAALINSLNQLLNVRPDHNWAHYARGVALLETGQYEPALDDLTRAVKGLQALPVTNRERQLAPLVIRKIGLLHELRGRFDLAEVELRRLLEEYEAVDASENELQFAGDLLLQLLLETNKTDKAQAIITEFMAKNPKVAYWPYQLGRLLMGREQYANAIPYLDSARQLAANLGPQAQAAVFADYLYALAKAGRAQEAAQQFKQSGATEPAVRARAAFALVQLNRRPEATEQLGIALTDAAKGGFGGMVGIIPMIKDVMPADVSRELIENVTRDTPATAAEGRWLRLYSASESMHTGDLAKAGTYVDAAIAAAPADSNERTEGLVLKGQILERDGKSENAAKAYEEILSSHPNHVGALNNLAYLLAMRLNRPLEGLKYAERALSLQAEGYPNADVLDTYGVALWKSDRLDEAESHLRQAIAVQPKHAAAWCHLGMLLQQRGNASQGRDALRRGMDLAKEAGDTDTLKEAEQAAKNVQ